MLPASTLRTSLRETVLLLEAMEATTLAFVLWRLAGTHLLLGGNLPAKGGGGVDAIMPLCVPLRTINGGLMVVTNCCR